MQFINNLVVNEQIIHNHNKRFVFIVAVVEILFILCMYQFIYKKS